MEGGWPDDSLGRTSEGGALCDSHARLHTAQTDAKVDVRLLLHHADVKQHLSSHDGVWWGQDLSSQRHPQNGTAV